MTNVSFLEFSQILEHFSDISELVVQRNILEESIQEILVMLSGQSQKEDLADLSSIQIASVPQLSPMMSLL